ncbi:MAG: DUF3224 family protein [Propionibacteriales bacterium]|nr:DUF3224 family protein [Propionibacteriales bacterium]
MTTHLQTKFEIKSWDDKPYRELEDGRKFSRADVELAASAGDVEGTATSESLLYYRADGTGSFVGLMHITGRLGDRSGSVALQGNGTYDGTEARVEYAVVPGSGTGDLAGMTGTALSVSTHADYPHMPLTLDYVIP